MRLYSGPDAVISSDPGSAVLLQRDAQQRPVQDAALVQGHVHVREGPAWHLRGLDGGVSVLGPVPGLRAGSHRPQSVRGVEVLLEPPATRRSHSQEQTTGCSGRSRVRGLRTDSITTTEAERGRRFAQACSRTRLRPSPLDGGKDAVLV